MVQAFKKGTAVRPGQLKKSHQGSHKFKKREALKKKAKVGQQIKLPTKKKALDDALDDAALSSAILRANEAKVASKMLQAGGKIGIGACPFLLFWLKRLCYLLIFLFQLNFLTLLSYLYIHTVDITERGKEINREKRRSQLTKKLSKAEQRLKVLEENQAIIDDMDICDGDRGDD